MAERTPTPPLRGAAGLADRQAETDRTTRELGRPLGSYIQPILISGSTFDANLAPEWEAEFYADVWATALRLDITPPEWATSAVVAMHSTISVSAAGGADVLSVSLRSTVQSQIGTTMGVGFYSLTGTDEARVGGSAPFYGIIELDGHLFIELQTLRSEGTITANNGIACDIAGLITWNR